MFSFLSKFMILNVSRLCALLDTKPNCIGEALKPERFSNEGDVGFIRDVCVDIVARNIYNSLKFPVSQSCEELANIRTSSGFFKCFKWKRSSKRNEKVTNEILAKAEKLIEELLHAVSHNVPANPDISAGEFLYDRTDEAKRRLIDSTAVAEDSHIVDCLEDMKIFLCKHCAMSKNEDMIDAVNQFKSNFEAQYETSLENITVEDTVASATITGLFRLYFEFKMDTNAMAGSVIMKIPSLAPYYNTMWKRTSPMYEREADFYKSILPTLYNMGQCEPFAPRLYAVAKRSAFVLEDLSLKKYTTIPRLVSLDLDHSRLFLDVLAKFHALGSVYFQNLEEDNPIKQLIGPYQPVIRREIHKEEFDVLCEMVKPFLNENLYRKMLLTKDEILARLPMQNFRDKNSMIVIMHGDLHRNNFLFKYDSNGKVSDVKLIDWQICTVGNPALDLIEFFVHNLHEEIFEANEDNLLEIYIATFNHNLSTVQSNRIYSRLELNRDMAYFKYYYFRVLSTTVIYWGASQSFEAHELISKNMAKWIMYFEKKGYI